jgi:hypothetical protein
MDTYETNGKQAFKNVRNMELFLDDNTHAPDGTQLILTSETILCYFAFH